jgi:hypothetical protein
MAKLDVYKPLAMKAQALKSTTESSTMPLKIDDIIAAAKMSMPAGPPGACVPRHPSPDHSFCNECRRLELDGKFGVSE